VLITTEAARVKVHVDAASTRVVVVPPGIELDDFPLVPAASAGRPPTVLFLANLRAHKGIFTLLDAFEEVVRRLPAARLLVAGGGPEAQAVRARVAASSAGASVELLGAIDPRYVAATMARADVFCQPGHGEPFGWSAVEAMACGLPVVVTDAGGLGGVVPDRAGLKVPPGEPVPLAAALVQLLDAPQRRATMGAVGRREVERTYAWDSVIDRLEGVYDDLARRRS